MNYIIAIAFLIIVDIVSEIPVCNHDAGDINKRIEKIERYLNLEFIGVEITGDVREINARIDEWNRCKNIPVYYNSYQEYMDSKVEGKINE